MSDEVAKELSQKAFSVTVKATKITGKVLFKVSKWVLGKLFVNKIKRNAEVKKEAKKQVKVQKAVDKKLVQSTGKQSMNSLSNQGKAITSLDLGDADIRNFDKIMTKYNVSYSVVTDKETKPPTHTLFFKGSDADSITSAFGEYTKKMLAKETKEAEKTARKTATQTVAKKKTSLRAKIKRNVYLVKKNVIKPLTKSKTPKNPSR